MRKDKSESKRAKRDNASGQKNVATLEEAKDGCSSDSDLEDPLHLDFDQDSDGDVFEKEDDELAAEGARILA